MEKSENHTDSDYTSIGIDKSSLISIPSCLWLPQGPIVQKPFTSKQAVDNENDNIQQSNISPHDSDDKNKTFSEKDISKSATDEYSGFSEFITNGEAIDREQQVKDKFNGILCHVIP